MDYDAIARKYKINLKSKYKIFILIFIFLTLLSLFPRCSTNAVQNIISWDFFAHLAKIRLLETQQNLANIDITMWRESEVTPYPPGYAIFLYFIKSLTGVNYFDLPFISIILWIITCLLLYILPSRLNNGYQIGLISALLGATFISGSNMLGPIYSTPANLDIIFILLVVLVLLSINDTRKVILCSLLLCVIFVTHRPGIGAWLIFFFITMVLPILFIKQKKEHLYLYALPAMVATIFAFDLSILLWWMNFPIDVIMRLGGIIPENLINLNSTIILTAFILFHFGILIVGRIFIRGYKGSNIILLKDQNIKISSNKILLVMTIIPITFIGLIIYYILIFKIPIGTNIFAVFVNFWSELSKSEPDFELNVIKQILYLWHINIFSLLLIMPSIYIAIKKRIVPPLITISVFFVASLFILFSIKFIFLWDLKIQRFYIYLAPFIFILCAWGFLSIISSLELNLRKKAFIVGKYLILISLLLGVLSVNYTTESMPLTSYNGYLFSQNLSAGGLIATHPSVAQEARGLGNFNFVARYYLFTVNIERIAESMEKTFYEYSFIQTYYSEAEQISPKFNNDTKYFNKIFDNSNTNIYRLNMQDITTKSVNQNNVKEEINELVTDQNEFSASEPNDFDFPSFKINMPRIIIFSILLLFIIIFFWIEKKDH